VRWAGVDVGAAKGFDLAVIDREGLVGVPERVAGVQDVARRLLELGPRVVAVDSPRSAAPDGELSRPCERELVGAHVCGIRYTPDAAALARNPSYYAWIANGFDLYRTLQAEADWKVIECFPTATWSRLGGPKGKQSRARWSSAVLDGLRMAALPGRMNQDARDAIGAAVTARLYDDGETEAFGEIVVPR
jgi:predicted nuclease with RNAse H fold